MRAVICGRGFAAAFFLMAAAVSAAPAKEDAAAALTQHLEALKDTQTLTAKFVCEKRLAMLETPLLSRGQLWIRKGDPRHDGAVRFSTEKPYVSELILAKGKVNVRSQHEKDWTQSNQGARPGLAAVMGQLGGWSTGDAGKVAEQYAITTASEKVPAMPQAGETPSTSPAGGAPAAAPPAAEADVFILTPTDKDLLKAVKQLKLAIDRKSHHLLFIEILTPQDDTTRYWFYDVEQNAKLPAEVFEPAAAAGGEKAHGDKP